MKTPTLPIRLAALLSVVFAAGHLLGGLQSWSPIGPTPVLSSMQTFRFDVSGVTRSYLDFYRGFGFLLGVFLVTEAVLLWQLANLARDDWARARPFVWIFLLSSLAMGALAWTFLFPMPAYFIAALAALLGWAAASGGRGPAQGAR